MAKRLWRKESESPFNPKDGLAFKYGCGFSDKRAQLAATEKDLGFQFPKYFTKLIGKFCEGGFKGWYLVSTSDDFYVVFTHLLLLVEFEGKDDVEIVSKWSIKRIMQQHSNVFKDACNTLKRVPFGEAFYRSDDYMHADGFLCFDVNQSNAIHFVSNDGDINIPIADSFEMMMRTSRFIFLD